MKDLTNKERFFLECSQKVLSAEVSISEAMNSSVANDCISDAIRIANRMSELIFDDNDNVRSFVNIDEILNNTPRDFNVL